MGRADLAHLAPSNFEDKVERYFQQIFKASEVSVRFSTYTHMSNDANGSYFNSTEKMEMAVDLKFYKNAISDTIKTYETNMQLFKYADLRSKRSDYNYDIVAYNLSFDLSDCDKFLAELSDLNKRVFDQNFNQDLEATLSST